MALTYSSAGARRHVRTASRRRCTSLATAGEGRMGVGTAQRILESRGIRLETGSLQSVGKPWLGATSPHLHRGLQVSGVIERADLQCEEAVAQLRTDLRSTFWAETSPDAPTALTAVLIDRDGTAQGKRTLNDGDIDGESRPARFLTVLAMTDRGEEWVACHRIANRTA
jgi:hypothetical protein